MADMALGANGKGGRLERRITCKILCLESPHALFEELLQMLDHRDSEEAASDDALTSTRVRNNSDFCGCVGWSYGRLGKGETDAVLHCLLHLVSD
jgi:hypothetical protein